MTRTIRICSVAIGFFFACSPMSAQTDGNRIRASVKDGQTVRITDDQGRELQGKIDTMTADGISMRVNGKLADVPYERIVRIDRPDDTLKNGALIGLGVGAALQASLRRKRVGLVESMRRQDGTQANRDVSGCDGESAERAFACGQPNP